MKIAVLDDGLNTDKIGNEIVIKKIWGDCQKESDMCHGTKVIYTIEKHCPISKEYYIYNIMSMFSMRSGDAIITALNDLLIHEVDVILMCLIVNNSNYYTEITRLCRELVNKGSIIIASASNNGEYSFPANLDSVIGVGRMVNRDYYAVWHRNKGIQILGDVSPEYIRVGKYKILFNGTSKAAARIAAVVLNQCVNKKQDVSKIEWFLKENLPHDFVDIIKDIENRCCRVKLKNRQIHCEILKILKSRGYKIDTDYKNYYFEDIVNSLEEFGSLIINILNEIDKSVDVDKLHYVDFMSTFALSNFLGG